MAGSEATDATKPSEANSKVGGNTHSQSTPKETDTQAPNYYMPIAEKYFAAKNASENSFVWSNGTEIPFQTNGTLKWEEQLDFSQDIIINGASLKDFIKYWVEFFRL